MYKINVEAPFCSAHNLRGYKGKCEALHGHNWKVQIEIVQAALDKAGMVMDFKEVKIRLNKILEKLDHAYLNKIPYFKKFNPTSENIAKYIFDCLKTKILNLNSVTVWESDNCSATYYE